MAPNLERVVFDEKVLDANNNYTSKVKLKSSKYIEDLEDPLIQDDKDVPKEVDALDPREYKIRYRNLINFCYAHIAGIYGGYLAFTSAQPLTLLFGK